MRVCEHAPYGSEKSHYARTAAAGQRPTVKPIASIMR